MESLHRVQNVLALRMLAYLQSLPDLHMRLEASDASCKEASKELFDSISPPLAGSMLVTGVISDGLFLSQTDESFRKVFAAKTDAFQAFESACPIESLDFFVAFSSFSSVGNAGQTNYSRCVYCYDYLLQHSHLFLQCQCGRDWLDTEVP